MSGYWRKPLAGVCLRPLGHLSVAVPYKAIRLDRKGNFAPVTLRSHRLNLQFLAVENENESATSDLSRTKRVQAVHGLDMEKMMMDEEPDPQFRPADLLPIVAQWNCPVCGTSHTAELHEDDAGHWAVPADERFVQCDECESNIDIGWAGWKWHDAA